MFISLSNIFGYKVSNLFVKLNIHSNIKSLIISIVLFSKSPVNLKSNLKANYKKYVLANVEKFKMIGEDENDRIVQQNTD